MNIICLLINGAIDLVFIDNNYFIQYYFWNSIPQLLKMKHKYNIHKGFSFTHHVNVNEWLKHTYKPDTGGTNKRWILTLRLWKAVFWPCSFECFRRGLSLSLLCDTTEPVSVSLSKLSRPLAAFPLQRERERTGYRVGVKNRYYYNESLCSRSLRWHLNKGGYRVVCEGCCPGLYWFIIIATFCSSQSQYFHSGKFIPRTVRLWDNSLTYITDSRVELLLKGW